MCCSNEETFLQCLAEISAHNTCMDDDADDVRTYMGWMGWMDIIQRDESISVVAALVRN
jgi:hypothetical protein